MYNPSHFQEPRVDVMQALMRDFPLATVVSCAEGAIDANHLPLYLDAGHGEFGILRGHVAKANPFCVENGANPDVLAIFRGPDAYITPSWYPAKQASGKVVPTWNYAVVHAHGTLRFEHDAGWIHRHLQQLTDNQEHLRNTPWRVSDAPEDYIERLASMVVGVEITVRRLEGKWKVSQNQPAGNGQGVVEGLRSENAGCPMAALVEAYMQK